ncbi:hypothetical protein E2C01_017210 [Portunus trituberculatus]|uniref:Uncharacterized protein n=1 Tax=Portunus trituberculatus TaxID=210409 RepID=A0A5B7DRU5_PORTR|nr:hypothetical protein [Portunus trituberculatus]
MDECLQLLLSWPCRDSRACFCGQQGDLRELEAATHWTPRQHARQNGCVIVTERGQPPACPRSVRGLSCTFVAHTKPCKPQ